jgi:hypothetical protein
MKIFDLINECRRIFYEISDVKRFSEEDVKLKLIFPFFEAFGWNVRDYHETLTEISYDCDETIENELKRKWPYLNYKKSLEVDCVFLVGNEPYIFLEAKKFDFKNLFSIIDYPDGEIIVAHAKKLKVKYVVFTNFLQMMIYEIETSSKIKFDDMSEYISKYNELEVLKKPVTKKNNIWKRETKKCFETFKNGPECNYCLLIKRSICEASTKLKQLGYEMKPV